MKHLLRGQLSKARRRRCRRKGIWRWGTKMSRGRPDGFPVERCGPDWVFWRGGSPWALDGRCTVLMDLFFSGGTCLRGFLHRWTLFYPDSGAWNGGGKTGKGAASAFHEGLSLDKICISGVVCFYFFWGGQCHVGVFLLFLPNTCLC